MISYVILLTETNWVLASYGKTLKFWNKLDFGVTKTASLQTEMGGKKNYRLQTKFKNISDTWKRFKVMVEQ